MSNNYKDAIKSARSLISHGHNNNITYLGANHLAYIVNEQKQGSMDTKNEYHPRLPYITDDLDEEKLQTPTSVIPSETP